MERGTYRLRGHDYRANRWYFVTVVTAGRAHLFGRIVGTEFQPSPLGRIAQEEIELLPKRREGVVVAISVVMPNHVHLLVGLYPAAGPEMEEPRRFEAPAAGSVGAIVGAWKAGVRRRAGAEGLWRKGELWQRRFHDRVVRDDEEWSGIADYILWNPVTWHHDPLSSAGEPTDEQLREWKARNDL